MLKSDSDQEDIGEQLRMTKLLLKASLENSKDTIILSIDNEYKYLSFNTAHHNTMSRVFGTDVKIGMNILDCIDTEVDRAKAKKNYDRALSGESHSIVEMYGDSERSYFESFFSPILDEKGAIIGATAFANDITNRKMTEEKLRESEELFRAVIENSYDAVVLMNAEREPTYVSPSYERLNGFTAQEWIDGYGPHVIHPDDHELITETFLTILKKPGALATIEYRLHHKKGHWFWVETKAINLLDNPHVRSVVMNCRDITERKQTEAEILQNEKSLQHLIQNLHAGVVVHAADTHILLANEQASRLLGLTIDQMMGKVAIDPAWCFIREDGTPMPVEEYPVARVFSTQAPIQNLVLGINRPSTNDCVWVMVNAFPELDSEGQIVQAVVTFVDISSRKNTEEALRVSEQSFRSLFENSYIAVAYHKMVYDASGKPINYIIEKANESFQKLTGINATGKLVTEAFPGIENDPFGYIAKYGDVAKTGKEMRFQTYFQFNDQWYDCVCYRNKPDHFVVVFLDITVQKKAEEALEWSMKLLNETGQMAHIGGWEIDLQKQELTWTDEVCRIHEVPMDFKPDIATAINFYSASSQPIISAAVNTLIEQGEPFDLVLEIITDKGNLRWVHALGKGVFLEDKIIKVSGTFQDITDRKNADLALSSEKERLAVTLRSIGDGVITTDSEGKITMLNKAAEEMTGWNSTDAVGRPLPEVFNIINEITRQQHDNPAEKVIATGAIMELANHTCLIAKDGSEIIIADSGAPIRDNESNIVGVVLVFRDISQKQKLIDAIQKAQKLDSLGLLAGGIAHDFNNLLGGMFGYVEIALNNLDNNKPEQARKSLVNAFDVFDRTKALTQQLLTFSKGGAPIRNTIDLTQLIGKCTQFSLSGSSVKSVFNISKDLWLCDCDENQIAQVIENIVMNAQQAMPMSGTIFVSADNMSLDEHHTGVGIQAGNFVKISIQDQGAGIAKDLLTKIYDPFFTTKEMGHGLGLATVYSIVNRHSGWIDVESKPGTGTTFHVFLPASQTEITPELIHSREIHNGKNTVLIMDDEKMLRDIEGSMLEDIGYDIALAKDGQDALKLFSDAFTSGKEFVATILDLTIPSGMGGAETVKAIREIDENAIVIVASGYADDPVMMNPSEYGFTAKIAKPFRRSELTELLDFHINKSL
ncbi:MAG: PAS domain S-box protein [Reichenbachiella sp.]